MKKSPRQQLFYTDIWMSMSVWRHSTAKRFRFRRWIRVETAPLKLRPYGAIQMCLLLLFYYYSPEQGADLHMVQLMPLPLTVSCFSKIQIGFTFLVPAHPGSLGKRAVKRVCVCVYYSPDSRIRSRIRQIDHCVVGGGHVTCGGEVNATYLGPWHISLAIMSQTKFLVSD